MISRSGSPTPESPSSGEKPSRTSPRRSLEGPGGSATSNRNPSESFSAAEAEEDPGGNTRAFVLESVGPNQEVIGLDQANKEPGIVGDVEPAPEGHRKSAQIILTGGGGRSGNGLAEAGVDPSKAEQAVHKRADPFIPAFRNAGTGEKGMKGQLAAVGSKGDCSVR